MVIQSVNSEKAPAAIGPYSQAVKAENTVYVSGQLPINRETGAFAGEDIVSQTKQSLENIKAILNEADMEMKDIVKTTVYLADITEFNAMNSVYADYFSEPYPARAAYQVCALPKAARVEIEAVAVK